MKKNRIISIIAIALFVSTALNVKASSPIVDVEMVEKPSKSLIQVSVDQSTAAFVSIVDNNGIVLFSDIMNPASDSDRVFDFSNLKDGKYTIKTNSELKDVIKTIEVKNSQVEVLNKVSEYKPVFKIKDNYLKVSYLNQNMKDIELSLENTSRVFAEHKEEAKLGFSNIMDISNLLNGEYFAKLEADGKTYYHYFDIIK